MKYLFIGGVGHSGTTMLNHIFSSHSLALTTKGESRVAESLPMLQEEYAGIASKSAKYKFIADIIYFGYRFKKDKFYNPDDDNNPYWQSDFDLDVLTDDLSADVRKVILETLQRTGKSLFVEKTPSNVFFHKNILKLVPDAKVIIIHRDVRDVVASLKKRYQTLLTNPEVFSHNLETKKLDKDYNLVIDSHLWAKAAKSEAAIKGQVTIVKYEDFVSNPETELKKLCSWLEIEFEPAMLSLKSRNSANQEEVKIAGVTDHSVGSYRKTLSAAEIAVVQKYAGKYLHEFGYELDKVGAKDKISATMLEVQSYGKVGVRVLKRLRLMKPKYALRFAKNLIYKLKI